MPQNVIVLHSNSSTAQPEIGHHRYQTVLSLKLATFSEISHHLQTQPGVRNIVGKEVQV